MKTITLRITPHPYSNRCLTVALITTCLSVLALLPAMATPELKPGMDNLEGAWRFRTDPEAVGEREGWQRPETEDRSWRTLRAPGYWEEQGITDPAPGRAPTPKNGVAWTDYDGVAWYRLRVVVPASWAGEDLVLHLGSVDDEDRTYFNGRVVGETGPGRAQAVTLARRYRIPAALVLPGRENVLAIRVTDGGGPGGIMGPQLYLLPARLIAGPPRLPGGDRPLAARFAEPAAEARILKIIHGWPDGPEAQDELIRALAFQGFGGVVCNVSFDRYLESETHWDAFTRAVRRAKQSGMSLWLYDERGYPSGSAGGITLRDRPEWAARGLLVADTICEGGALHQKVPPGKLVTATAYPLRDGVIDLRGAVDLSTHLRGAELDWQAPPGRWRVLLFTEERIYDGTHASLSLGDRLPYINLLQPEPTARFLEVTHGRYAAHLGADMGAYFVSTFTDEPSLMSLFMRPMPWRVLPWAPNLPTEFQRRRGRPLEPLLPLLVADAGAAGRRARYDFWQTVGELVSENYFGQIQRWCAQHHLRSGGHLLMEESLVSHVPLYGDLFRCLRRLDAPSIDCLTSVPGEVPWTIARLASSVAELEGRSVTMCETSDFVQRYRTGNDTRPVRTVTPEEIRGTCNRLMLGGIRTITSYYTFTGVSGAQIAELNRWVGRCVTMLSGGRSTADIAVLYPIQSVWPRFVPSRGPASASADASRIEGLFQTVSESLYAERRDFLFVDGRALTEARPQGGSLVHGRLRWRVVVLPGADTLPMAAWANLARFVRSGGVVVAVGALPANSETELPSARVRALARELFGVPAGPHIQAHPGGGAGIYLPAGSEALLPSVIGSILGPEVRVDDPRAPVRAAHRSINGREVYFLINDGAAPWRGRVSVAADGPGERWDPARGTATPLNSARGIALDLPPYGAALLRFPAARPIARKALRTGDLPGLALRSLPETRPAVAQGEFVRPSLTPDSAMGTAHAPAWRATGTLAKSNVDTFLFVTLPYRQGLDLRSVDCLALTTRAPVGQSTAAELLVMLVDRLGRTWYAASGRSLAGPAESRLYLPLRRFGPAPWAAGPPGELDWSSIVAVNVGWGGYFGTAGERVEFSLGMPALGRAAGSR